MAVTEAWSLSSVGGPAGRTNGLTLSLANLGSSAFQTMPGSWGLADRCLSLRWLTPPFYYPWPCRPQLFWLDTFFLPYLIVSLTPGETIMTLETSVTKGGGVLYLGLPLSLTHSESLSCTPHPNLESPGDSCILLPFLLPTQTVFTLIATLPPQCPKCWNDGHAPPRPTFILLISHWVEGHRSCDPGVIPLRPNFFQ